MCYSMFNTPIGLTICRSPVSCPMSDNTDVGSGYETDSDLEDEEDMGDLDVAETSTPKSLYFPAFAEQPPS